LADFVEKLYGCRVVGSLIQFS